MATDIREHFLSNPQTISEEKFPIIYGKCEHQPFSNNNYFFIVLPSLLWAGSKYNDHHHHDDFTFIVEAQYAKQSIMNEYRQNVTEWALISDKIFVGSWCPKYEVLWKDVPVFIHESDPDIKYGYCRTQSKKRPERELWYVSIRNSSTFIVDKICTTNEYISRIGHDKRKWMKICWCHLDHEVEWDKLQTGSSEGGYVRTHNFSLDSPYIPDSIEDIDSLLCKYEKELDALYRKRGINIK